jgi:hypothetical protein
MDKTLKFVFNIFIFVMVAAFIAYIIKSVNREDVALTDGQPENTFVSSYKKIGELVAKDTITTFCVVDSLVFILSGQCLMEYGIDGRLIDTFKIQSVARDILVDNGLVYFLYPTFIEVYSFGRDSIYSWEACSDLSDYCAFTKAGGYIFVTDAGNKNVCKYTVEGNFIRFINSPHGFVTPGYVFDIAAYNDTVYCVNPGRHLIESYTLQGDFIAAFGGPGSENGFFSGCCNPAFITIDKQGNIYTSEKGNPRISRYSNKGVFDEVVLNNQLLGGGYLPRKIKDVNNSLWVANYNRIEIYTKKISLDNHFQQ